MKKIKKLSVFSLARNFWKNGMRRCDQFDPSTNFPHDLSFVSKFSILVLVGEEGEDLIITKLNYLMPCVANKVSVVFCAQVDFQNENFCSQSAFVVLHVPKCSDLGLIVAPHVKLILFCTPVASCRPSVLHTVKNLETNFWLFMHSDRTSELTGHVHSCA